jgi:type IV pilus assembly protein PilV
MGQLMLRQRGFSLIEALIALVVLSIGLLGVAAMQVKALQSATVGYQRSVATLAAVDAQERLWAALAQLPSGKNCADVKDELTKQDDSGIEDKWKELWSQDVPSNPLRSAIWNNSKIEDTSTPPVTCEFTITIALGDGPGDIDGDEFAYTFRLP